MMEAVRAAGVGDAFGLQRKEMCDPREAQHALYMQTTRAVK